MPTLAAVQSSCAFASPHHLDQALQRELTALATFEAAHRSACRWLDEWSGPQAGAVEVIRAGESLMGEVMPLQVAPDPFDRFVMTTLDCWFVLRPERRGRARCAGCRPLPSGP